MIIEGERCRICGLPCKIADTDIGPVLKHLSATVEANHTAVEDDGSYFASLPRPCGPPSTPVNTSAFDNEFVGSEFG